MVAYFKAKAQQQAIEKAKCVFQHPSMLHFSSACTICACMRCTHILCPILWLRSGDASIPPCRVFGWTRANEINNGRWVMMGFAIGLLTEYATGVDFPHQLALMFSYLGIADVDY
jgi:hypothetical protein